MRKIQFPAQNIVWWYDWHGDEGIEVELLDLDFTEVSSSNNGWMEWLQINITISSWFGDMGFSSVELIHELSDL